MSTLQYGTATKLRSELNFIWDAELQYIHSDSGKDAGIRLKGMYLKNN